MKINQTGIEGLIEIYPEIYEDKRGTFFESYNERKLKDLGIPEKFLLEFQSLSKKGAIRGLHFQKEPFAQGKLVRVVRGEVLDVVVDIRKNSSTFGKWKSFLLDDKENKSLWIPVGFAHGFVSLVDNTIMFYKVTNGYHKDSEGGIKWDDPELKIDWQLDKFGIDAPIVSDKDAGLSNLSELEDIF